MISVNIDHSRFDSAMDGFRDAMVGEGKDLVTILVDAHRQLTKTIVNFVPPPIGQGSSPRILGEEAVKKDIYALASEAIPKLIDETASRYGISDVDTYITGQDGQQIHIQWENVDWDGTKLPDLHQGYRNRYGRVPHYKTRKGEWKSRVVVPFGTRDAYVKTVQARVGRFKAKIAWAAWRLGAKFPSYITRHFGSIGGKAIAEFDLGSKNPTITFGAVNPGISRIRQSISNAFKLAAESLKFRTKLAISGYAKDVAEGRRPRAHAAEHKQPEEEAE